MKDERDAAGSPLAPLQRAARVAPDKVCNPGALAADAWNADRPVLVVLAAGKGTRFGASPKCIQPVAGRPLARHTVDAFRRCFAGPAVVMVGYRHEEVAAALGPDNLYVRSDNPTGGTAYAAYEAFSAADLEKTDPLLFLAMGDRVAPDSIFRRLWDTHRAGGREADLTFLTAQYEPPRNRGKGRVLRDADGRVLRLIEERDIAAEPDELTRQALSSLTEGNCPLYLVRAAVLRRLLGELTADNAQGQYYLTDIIAAIRAADGDIRTVTTTPAEPEYDLLCADVTRPDDLALLEGLVQGRRDLLGGEGTAVETAAHALAADRPAGQVASIARQLAELLAGESREHVGFDPHAPAGIGVAGGRLRLAFMHPDMARFYGPAWQMPIGAADESGNEQVVMLTQEAHDRRLHLVPMDPRFRESVNELPSDTAAMYPGEQVSDLHAYEAFGTHMSETLLLALGYFSDEELAARRARGLPLPPPALWASGNMRRPFALVGNALASLRTLREGNLGARVKACLGAERFGGLRVICTGGIPRGGFSSSSAVTLAVKNALNALYGLGIPDDLLIRLASQAEYGTGVRAGSLDQATEQKGRAGQGALISSNPADNYRILAMFPVPAERFPILFPYSVERDREAWRWSWGGYAESAGGPVLTAGEMRKMTGKAAEIAAVLTRLPMETSFFKGIEADLVGTGSLTDAARARVRDLLLAVPLRIGRAELKARLEVERGWYEAQLREKGLGPADAARQAAAMPDALLEGWREPRLRRTLPAGERVEETGVPLRAMLAYLFGETAKNAYLIHHPDAWIACVTASQGGDRCVDLDPARLPARAELEREQDWERDADGPARLDRWLDRFGADPVDFNRGLDDTALAAGLPAFERLEGSNFFRGLALIDLAEAMLKRAFGPDAVAVRVNAAGQGDYFQVHVDRHRADPESVKSFIRAAFYRRFGLAPDPDFVEPHPGGGAAAARLDRYEELPRLVQRLREVAAERGRKRAG